ncbi:ABC transporter substrate-binding protein [Cytobacillus sp. FJAT-53684]|uniref:ABC transporter substrate-binding protein n=1 Tax=Cytobacillus mangrovibacter TaxID=3299024 RepID=A0ABW6JXE9_9BACI
MGTTKHFRKPILFFTMLILSMLVMIGCSSNTTSTPDGNSDNSPDSNKETSEETSAPQSGGTITIGTMQEPDTLDVHKTSMSIASVITNHLGGTLLSVDPETNELEPNLAESYQVSEDGQTITFKIRQGVTLTDGTPLTAKVYKDTFDRILNPETGATVAASLIGGIQATAAPDDHTFVIELAAPSAPFLRNLTSRGYLQPLSMAAIEKYGADYGRNPVGAGPYIFKEWVTGQSITLERNDDFNWPRASAENQGKAHPDQIVYKFIQDQQTMLAALDSGSIDVAMEVPPKDVQRYRDNPDYYVLEAERQGLGLFLEMNLEDETLSDLNVRKAINMAINKDAIIKAVINGEGTPAFGPIPSAVFGYDPNVENYGHKLNKDEAINLLEQSGYAKNGKGIMEKDGKELAFELSIMTQHNQAAQMVQAMLKDVGINVSIQSLEAGTLIEKVSQGDYQMSFLAYSYIDPDILYLLFHSSQIGGLNHVRVQNSELDDLLEKGRTTIDPEERKQVYAQVQEIVVENAYWAPIYAEKVFFVVNKRVQNVKAMDTSIEFQDSWVKQ